MSGTIAFGPGRYNFFLPMARIVEVERLCGDKSIILMYEEMSAGVGLDRETEEPRFVGAGSARIKDVYEVIRCAAIGGGMSPGEASDLVREYVDGRPYRETVPVAWAILHAALLGDPPAPDSAAQKKSGADTSRSNAET